MGTGRGLAAKSELPTVVDDQRTAAERICRALHDAGHRALLAGGCVRDLLLGNPPRDFDVATSAHPEQVMALFEKTVPVGAAYGVVIVVEPEGPIEVATFRSDGPYLDGRHPSVVTFRGEREDAARRDFTINAMFYDPCAKQVIDYVDGQADLRAKIVRTVGDPEVRFSEDYLRLLRAVRFAARLEFDIERITYEAIQRLAHLIKETGVERIRDELIKMLTEGGTRRAFELMDDTGLLEHVLPEVARMKGVQQPPEFHPEGDVFHHTILMLDRLQNPSPALALGVLLHDVGKPPTAKEEDRIRFNNHDKVGAQIAEEICRRLRLSNEVTERVVWLVDQHMRVAHAPQMRESKLKRFIREDGFDELLELARLDCLTSHADLRTIEWIERYRSELKPEAVRPTPVLTGHDLIAMGYAPGPLFSEMLRVVEDAQLEGAIRTKAEAEAMVRDRWPRGATP